MSRSVHSAAGLQKRQPQQQQQAAANPLAALSEHRPGAAINPDYDPYKLEFILANDLVQYKCSCGEYRRLSGTYLCRHCMAMRCRSCVAYEVDSQYCQHCLEYIPTIDPKFQMNRCASCYQCPSCQHLLSTLVLSTLPPQGAPQAAGAVPTQPDEVVRRTCQLVCEFCRWSSDTFMTEGSRIINNMADVEVAETDRINELISFYKAMSQKEKTDKKKLRFTARRGNPMDLLKKHQIDKTLSPKLFESLRARIAFQDQSSVLSKYNLEPKTNEESAIESFKQAEARKPEELERLDTNFHYGKDFNIEKISSIEQRLAQVEIQPDKVADFKPISKSLSVKRSLRCRGVNASESGTFECKRNLCRSEYSPVSIRFKIQSAAYYYVPELRIRSDVHPIKLKLDQINIVEFSVQNQTQSPVKLKFEKCSKDNADCDIVLPPPELNLGPKDYDTADYEHVPLQIRPLNEETHITFQSPFKIGFFIKIMPKKQVDRLAIEFLMTHDIFKIIGPEEKEQVSVTHTVRVNLGPVD